MSLTPTKKKNVRASITAYCRQAVSNEPRIHYARTRRFPYYDKIGQGAVTLDCSGFVGNVFWNAMHDVGVYIHDPLNERYTGEGYTGTLETYLRSKGKPVYEANGYLVGDIVRWGNGEHAHTAVCSKAGSAASAEWTSHGKEAGPVVVKLGYRDDLIGVWRIPELL